MIGHRLMGTSLVFTGDIAEGRAHLRSGNRALRSCRASSTCDAVWPRRPGWQSCAYRSLALWLLGYPDAALADAEHALKDAREIGQAATLMYALIHASFTHICCGNYATANAVLDELARFGGRKGRLVSGRQREWCYQGCVLAADWQSLGRRSHDHLRDDRISVNGSNSLCAVVSCHTWREPMRNLANSMTLGAALAKR